MAYDYPLSKLPRSIDSIIYLISQELKIRRLFDGLHKAGMDDCYFEPHLDRIILSEIGLYDGTDKTMEFYCKVIEKRSKKIKPCRESIVKQSFKVYMELSAEKIKRKNEKQ